jgi:hypothetical protein
MARAIFVRILGAAGVLALSFFLVGVIPFFSAGPSVGAGYFSRPPAAVVNRAFKGDRLPMPSEVNSALTKSEPQRSQNSRHVPDGCDRSFSPISAPQLANVYGRCTV